MTPGRLLAERYELVRPLGSGGMGQVWLGLDRVLGREVAVKLVDLSTARDATAEERFRREGRAAAALSHVHVVTVFDSGTDASTAFLVMQLLPGPTVEALLQQGQQLPIAQAVEIAEQTAAALEAMHRIGIVHRDIKPANLMFDADGRIQVVDFGIASLAESVTARLTSASMVVGSAAFMAPEQANGTPATAATDLYALGCVLMALLTGRPPFEAEHPLGILQQHVGAAPPRVSDRRAEVPAPLDALVDELLAKAPEQRPAATAVLERLAAIRATLPEATAIMPGAAAAAAAAAASSAAATVPLLSGASTEQLRAGPAAPGATAPTERLAPALGAATTRVLPPVAAAQPTSAAGRPRRGWRDWRVLAAAGALLLLLVLLVPAVLDGLRGGGTADADASQPPAAETPAATAVEPAPADPAPAEPAPAEPAPAAPDPVAPADPFAGLRDAIRGAVAAGELDGEAGDDLIERTGEIEERIAEGKTEDLPQRLRELERKVDEMLRDEEITSGGAEALRLAIQQAEASLS